MSALPFPRFPPIDPIDPCRSVSRQLVYVNEMLTLTTDLAFERTGSAFVTKRKTLCRSVMIELLKEFAIDWNGVVPPFIPLICRGTYGHLRTKQREAYRMLALLEGRADDFINGAFVVNGFIINRPHNRNLRLQRWLQGMGY